jgi:hypothetical protein
MSEQHKKTITEILQVLRGGPTIEAISCVMGALTVFISENTKNAGEFFEYLESTIEATKEMSDELKKRLTEQHQKPKG